MTDTGTGDLIKRLERQAYFMCASCNEAPLPEEQRCHHADELRMVDGEPWCEVCHEDSGAFPNISWSERPAFTPFIELVAAAKAESADALEAAESVMRDIDRHAKAIEGAVADAAPEWHSEIVSYLMDNRDWLAAHATGQRAPLSQAAQDARRPPPITQFLEAEQDRPDFPARARHATGQRQSRGGAICSDCPPEGYPTDRTRCDGCPRGQRQGGDDE